MQDIKNRVNTFRSTVFTRNKLNCSGCGVCAQICAHGAIKMQEDSEGFLFPQIDSEKCVLCGLCDKTCPEVNSRFENNQSDQQFYIAANKRPQQYKDCATIGLCSIVAEFILSIRGYVFGVALDEKVWKAKHICIDNPSKIDLIKNSKYIQSDTDDSFKKVKDLLRKEEKVLFIGTPCQVSGLKAFLRKDYENLYTIDIICHGTYSYKILQKEISYWQEKFHGQISNFRFRSRRKYGWNYGGIVNFNVTSDDGRVKHVERHGSASPAYRWYAYSPDGINYTLRESCYSCKFRDEGRYGDLTIGDAWKIKGRHEAIFTTDNIYNGITAFSCNTEKAQKLLDEFKIKLDLQEIGRDEFFCQDALRPVNRNIPSRRSEIYAHMKDGDWSTFVQQFFKVNLDDVQKSFDTTYFKHKLKQSLKSVIKLLKWKK